MALTTYTCPYCGRKGVSRSLGGLKSHISQTSPCWEKRDKEHRRLRLLKRKRDPPVEASEAPPHVSDGIDDTGDETDGNPHPKQAHTEAQYPSSFQPTKVAAIVDYPEEAGAGAVIVDAEGDYIRKVDNDCFLPFPDLFVREGGEQE